jgi:Rod binding domain-containing protein
MGTWEDGSDPVQIELEDAGRLAGNEQSGPSPRLVAAAHEFEGQMMKELLEPMTRSGGLSGEDGDDDAGTGSGGALSEFAAEALGQSLSQHGGFGIADRIVRELAGSGNRRAGGK